MNENIERNGAGASGPTARAAPVALIIGAGAGLSASLARALSARGHDVVLVARDTSDLMPLLEETGASAFDCDAGDADEMARLFERVDERAGELAVAVYNPSARSRGPIIEIDPAAVEDALRVSAFGAFLMAHHAARRMLGRGAGTLLFTGASAGVKGYANSAPFAMGKFALRGLCQSLARELHPKGVHVGHVVVDGGIADASRRDRADASGTPDTMLDPDAIASSYLHLIDQHRSAWAWEVELRPWTETF